MVSIDLLMIIGIFVYGFILGFSNTFNRVKAFVFRGSYSQSELGILLDFIWYVSVIFYIIKYYK